MQTVRRDDSSETVREPRREPRVTSEMDIGRDNVRIFKTEFPNKKKGSSVFTRIVVSGGALSEIVTEFNKKIILPESDGFTPEDIMVFSDLKKAERGVTVPVLEMLRRATAHAVEELRKLQG